MHDPRALVDAYAVAVDERDGAAFAELFEPDGVLIVLGPDGVESHRYAGTAALAEVPASLVRYDGTLHLVSTHRWHADGDRATGVTYCEAHHRTGEADKVRYIRYDDDYVRADDGWRIAARRVTTVWLEER